ncbi:hypothetical protein H0H92_015519, partial [Tricholoma furcatifolium]
HNPARISSCPVTLHAVLHVADSVEAAGPVWCYWAFPMERYCGKLQPAIRSRRFPFAAIDRYILEEAQLTQIMVIYDVANELKFRRPAAPLQGFRDPSYPTCILLPPSKLHQNLPSNLIRYIAAALRTRIEASTAFNFSELETSTRAGGHRTGRRTSIITLTRVTSLLKNASIQEWGKVRRIQGGPGFKLRHRGLVRQKHG